jgi:hypothetical protein
VIRKKASVIGILRIAVSPGFILQLLEQFEA